MKKRALLLTAAMILALMLAGCGGGQAQPHPAETQAAEARAEETRAGGAGTAETQAVKDAASDLQAAKGVAFTTGTGSAAVEEEENSFLTEDLYDGIIRDEKDAQKALRGLFGRLGVEEDTVLEPVYIRPNEDGLVWYIFRQQMGVPPYRYLQQCRVHRAQELLRTTQQPVAEIAASVGLPDPVNFIRHFRSVTGTTPAKYRKETMRLP